MENEVLAKVNGKPVTNADVDAFLGRLDPQMKAQYNNAEGRRHILNEVINQQLFLHDAIDNKYDETEVYKSEMEKAREFILIQMNMNSFFASQQVTEEEIKEHFDNNPNRFDMPEKANTSHILVDSEELCKELREQIIKEEISFEDAAAQHSKCPSKNQGGNLGEYEKGKMVPEYDNAAFALEVDQISEPVKTQFGFHLIKLHSKTAAEKADYNNVKESVKKDLINEKQRKAYTDKINEMRVKYAIEMFD